jgi:hypothetical protein
MDHDRLRAISAEMCTLLDLQVSLMKTSPESLGFIGRVDMDDFHARNQRLRDLCRELTDLP